MDCEKLDKLERRIIALETYDKYFLTSGATEMAKGNPPFSPGDLVMRKDGKAWEFFYGISNLPTYLGRVVESIEKKTIICLHPTEFITRCVDTSSLTLAPAKPTPEQIQGYELTGEFSPAEKGPFWAHNWGLGIVISETDCGRHSGPCWILRRKKIMKVEFEAELIYMTTAMIQDGMYFIKGGKAGLPVMPAEKLCKITVEWQEE